MRTWCLAFHADYRCRHAGDCCGAAWDIEVEPGVVHAVMHQRIVPLHPGVEPFQTGPDGVTALGRSSTGDCHFHRGSRCSLQTAGGEGLLPSACRHFPRILLLDARGCLLTLSHYCPTAAALLLDEGPISVVEAHPPLALTGGLEGLDAREALPPLLRPGMLMDLADYDRFESACLRTFAEGTGVATSLARIANASEAIRTWRPADGALAARIDRAFADAPVTASGPLPLSAGFEIARALIGPHPDLNVPDRFAALWIESTRIGGPSLQQVLARYLAASTFGNWMPYRGEGLRTTVDWLHACYDVVRIQIVREAGDPPALTRDSLIRAVRAADYLLVHTVDSLAFGRALVSREHRPDRS